MVQLQNIERIHLLKKIIKVKECHIKSGKRGKENSCPVAKAIKAFVRSKDSLVSVKYTSIYISKKPGVTSYTDISKRRDIVDKIQIFDRCGTMEPFEFELEIEDNFFVKGN